MEASSTQVRVVVREESRKLLPTDMVDVFAQSLKSIEAADRQFETERMEYDQQTEQLLAHKDKNVAKVLSDIVGNLEEACRNQAQGNAREIETLITTYDLKLMEAAKANEALLAQNEALKLEVSAVKFSWEEDRQGLLAKTKKAKADAAKALQDARDKADKRLQAAEQAAEKRFADMQFKLQTEIAGLQETLKVEVALRESKEQEIKALRQERTELIASWRAKFEEQKEIDKEDRKQMKKVMEEHEQRVVKQFEAKVGALESTVAQMKADFQAKEAEFAKAIEEELKAEDRTLNELAAVKEARDRVLADKEQQIRELHEVVEIKILEIKELHAAHRLAMEEKDLAHKVHMDELRLWYEAKILACAEELALLQIQYNNAVGGLRKEVKDKEKEFEMAFAALELQAATDLVALKEMADKRAARLAAQLQNAQAALAAEKDQHAVDIIRVREEELAILIAAKLECAELFEIMKGELSSKIVQVEELKRALEIDLWARITEKEELFAALQAEMKTKLERAEIHYCELLKTMKDESDQHLERMTAQVTSLHASLDNLKRDKEQQVASLNAAMDNLRKSKDADIASLKAEMARKLKECKTDGDRKLKEQRQAMMMRIAQKQKKLDDLKKEYALAVETLRIDMAEARMAAQVTLEVQIVKDEEIMLLMRAEFKLKIEELELLMVATALEAAAKLEAMEKEFMDSKGAWILHEAKQKAEYDAVILAELGAEASLVAEVDRLKLRLKGEAEAALVVLAMLRAEMNDAIARKDAENKDLCLAYEAKLDVLRAETRDALIAEREACGAKLQEKDAQLLRASKQFQEKLNNEREFLAGFKLQAKRDLDNAVAEGLAVQAALASELGGKILALEEAMLFREAEFKKQLQDLEAARRADAEHVSEVIAMKEKTWMQEVAVMEAEGAAEERKLNETIKVLREDLALLAIAKELEIVALVEAHNKKVLAFEERILAEVLVVQILYDEMQVKFNNLLQKSADDERAMKAAFSAEKLELERFMAVAILAKDEELEQVGKLAHDLVEQKRAECEAALAKMRSDCTERVRRLNDKLEQLRNDLRAAAEQRVAERDKEKADFMRQLELLEDKKAKQLAAQKDAAAAELLALTGSFEAKISKLSAALKEDKAKMEAMQAAREKQLAAMEMKYKKWLDEEIAVDVALKEERDLLKKSAQHIQNELEKQSALNAHQAESDARNLRVRIDEERALAAGKIKELELVLVAMEEECKAKMAEFAAAKDFECAAKVLYIAEQLEREQKAHDALVHEHEAAIVALEDDLRKRAESKEKDLEARYLKSQQALEDAKKARNQALTDKDAKTADLRHEYERLLDERDKKYRDDLAKANKDSQDQLNAKKDELAAMTAACRDKIADKDAQISDMRKSAEEQLKTKDLGQKDQQIKFDKKLEKEELRHLEAEKALKAKQTQDLAVMVTRLEDATAKALREIGRKDAELEAAAKRMAQAIEAKDKEIEQFKSRVRAKDQELKDTIVALQKEEEINDMELKQQLNLLRAEYNEKITRFEAALLNAEQKAIKELAKKEEAWKSAKRKDLDELRVVLEARTLAAEQKSQAAVDAAVAIVIADKVLVIEEKEALFVKFSDLEAQMAKVLAGEMAAESHVEDKCSKLKKEMAALERKKDSEIDRIAHELEVVNGQKNRVREEEARARDQLKAKAAKEVSSLEKELGLKAEEEKRHIKDQASDYEAKLKLREQEIASLKAECLSLKDRVFEEEIDIEVEVDIVEVVEVIEVRR